MQDYVNSRAIGCDNADIRLVGDWELFYTDANQTRDGFLKAFREWYASTRLQMPTSDCIMYDTYYNEITGYTTDNRYIAFNTLMQTNSGMDTLTREIWDDYLAAVSEMMCKVKQLMEYLDGDRFEPFYP